MRRGVENEGAEQDLRRWAELGRLLAAAEGYRVVASDGAQLGWLDYVRYERHADHPDEIVVRRRGLLPRRCRACCLGYVYATVLGPTRVAEALGESLPGDEACGPLATAPIHFQADEQLGVTLLYTRLPAAEEFAADAERHALRPAGACLAAKLVDGTRAVREEG